MSPLPGSRAEYKYRDVPFAIWFDRERLSWCLDLRGYDKVGKLICDLPGASQAVLAGKQRIEEASKRPMPESWYEKHAAARQRVIDRYKAGIRVLEASGPFRIRDLARVVARSEKTTSEVVASFVEQGFLEATVVRDPVVERFREMLAQMPEFTMRDIEKHIDAPRWRSKHFLKRMRDQGFIRDVAPRRSVKGSAGALPAVYALTSKGEQWVRREIPIRLSTRSTYPAVFYRLTPKGVTWTKQGGSIMNEMYANPSSMTLKQAHAIVRKLGITLTRTPHGEYRVNFVGGHEGTAYYTNDLEDAVRTAEQMASERSQPLVQRLDPLRAGVLFGHYPGGSAEAQDHADMASAISAARQQGFTYIAKGGGPAYSIYRPRNEGGFYAGKLFHKRGNWHVGSDVKFVPEIPPNEFVTRLVAEEIENPRKKDLYIKSPNGRYILSRDGKIVMRGTEDEVWRYIHNTHGYSLGHALKYEGYKIQPDLSLAENPRGAFYRRRYYFTDIYTALTEFHRFTPTNAKRALAMYREDIHSYYNKRVPAAVTASVIARYFPG